MKRIALIYAAIRPISTYPAFVNSILLLQERGYKVDIYLDKRMDVDIALSDVDIFWLKGVVWQLFFFLRQLPRKKYDRIIFYGDKELITGGFVCLLLRQPYIYFAMEIRDYDELKTVADLVRKKLEIFFNKRSFLTVIQDETRKTVIQALHGLDPDRFSIVPNAFMRVNSRKQNLVRERFGISADKVIVLYSGALQRWALDEELIKAAASWSDRFVLVLHGFKIDDFFETLRQKAMEVNSRVSGRIYISTDVLPEKEYLDFVGSADIGLAWYKRNPLNNVKTIGKSSGKFSAFMACGVPVVVPSYLDALKGFVDSYHCGLAVGREDQIREALDHMAERIKEYENNARFFYEQELNFEKSFKEFLLKVENFN